MKNSKMNIAVVIFLVIGVFLLFSACRTIVIHGDDDGGSRPPKKPDKPDKPDKHISKGDVIIVTGRVEREKNYYYIHDVNSSRSFRVVGLSQGEKNALYERDGEVVKIKLKVTSVESKHSYVTHFVKLY